MVGPEIPATLGCEVGGFKFETSLGYITTANVLGGRKRLWMLLSDRVYVRPQVESLVQKFKTITKYM
jgi:translation initiation factor IF-1